MSDNETTVARGALREPSHVVGIGASAGGLDALVAFFDNLPRDTGMAFVVVQHLSPDFKSLMDELLGRHTTLPIHLVEDGMPVEADHVYLIPAKKEMIISGGRLLLSERDRQQELTLPIDVFFRSLAQDCGAARGRDRAVRRRQRRLARHPRRPRGGRPGARPGRRQRAVRRHAAGRAATPASPTTCCRPRTCRACSLEHAGRAPGGAGRARPAPPRRRPASRPCTGCCRSEFGIDFTHYKPSTVTRRIERRLALARVARTSTSTWSGCATERDELDALYRDLLIGVTRFFRDPEAFALLEQQVLPELLRADAARTRRCASGSRAAPPARRRTRSRSCCTS